MSSVTRTTLRRWVRSSTTRAPPRAARRYHTLAAVPMRTKAPPPVSWMALVLRTYQYGIQRYPLGTKVTMAVFIFATSDVVTQKLLLPPTTASLHKKDASHSEREDTAKDDAGVVPSWDTSRTLSAAVFGVASTTFLHYWWGLLERSFARILPLRHTHFVPTLAKVLVHQSCAAPFYIYSYYVVTNFVQQVLTMEVGAEGGLFSVSRLERMPQSWYSVHAKAQEMLWPTMLRHWSVWPLVQTANFYCISLHHRILVHNSVLMLWSGYLSYLNHHDPSSLDRNRSLFHDLYEYYSAGIWVRTGRGKEDDAGVVSSTARSPSSGEEDTEGGASSEAARTRVALAPRHTTRERTLPTT
jgi:Mpv17 / PMP22 family